MAGKLLILATLFALWSAPPFGAAQDGSGIEVWFLTDPSNQRTRAGARMAAAEVTQTANLLGKAFVLREVEIFSLDDARTVLASAARPDHTTFAVLDLDWPAACSLAGDARAGRAVVLATQVGEDACDAALLQLRLPHGDREKALAAHARDRSPGDVRVDEWHPSLKRFGAGELNERFERYIARQSGAVSLGETGGSVPRLMDGDAWAGWFAVKVAAESALRGVETQERLTDPDGPAFDGHKGVALRFDRSGVLRQPVFIISAAAGPNPRGVVAEIP
jgi:hypothetical protein